MQGDVIPSDDVVGHTPDAPMSDQHGLLVNLPTGKPHISYSEMKEWRSCSWKHHLKKVKGLDLDTTSMALEFGTAIHASLEEYLRTGELSHKPALGHIAEAYLLNPDHKDFKRDTIFQTMETAVSLLNEVPEFMSKEFPGWSCVVAEEQLYEPIEDQPGHRFKGFIDGIIKVPGKTPDKDVYHLIDWKTSNAGWYGDKRSDPLTTNQVVVYKHYWAKKHGIPLNRIKTAYIIIKKSGKPGTRCERFAVSSTDLAISRALPMVDSMINALHNGKPMKNRTSCKWCEFKGTEHCT